jgi:hypothetical protein
MSETVKKISDVEVCTVWGTWSTMSWLKPLLLAGLIVFLTGCTVAQASENADIFSDFSGVTPGFISGLTLDELPEERPVLQEDRASVDALQSDHTIYLPRIGNQPQVAWRIGYAQTSSNYNLPGLDSLLAGWYLNWSTGVHAVRPNGMEYAQMIRVHQDLVCPLGGPQSHNRTICPYVVPHSYTHWPSASRIQQIAAANPGSLWLIGNEIDRRDWPGGRQDEILPELYAVAYHELYHLIKEVDPNALVAIGGVVQTTPLRLEYLAKVWDTYLDRYGVPMPVDVWNMHVFVLPEKLDSWGASIPVGSNALTGAYIFRPDASGTATTPMPEHIDLKYVDEQVRAMRAWMKERGQQQKPLIVTEYGVLLPNVLIGKSATDSQAVIDFMIGSFEYFLHTKDCSLGYATDDCRLIQRWAWWSLDYDRSNSFNLHASLYDGVTGQMNPSGIAFRDWVRANMAELSRRPAQ